MTSIRWPAGSRTNERGASHAFVPSRSVKPAPVSRSSVASKSSASTAT